MLAAKRDIAALLSGAHGGQLDVLAGGAGDNTEENGSWVDAIDYESAVLYLAVEAVLGDGATASVAMNAQTASDDQGTGVADYGDAHANAVLLTGGAGGTTEQGVVELPLSLVQSDFLGFIRGQFTVDLSAATTDTARASLVIVRGGPREAPVA